MPEVLHDEGRRCCVGGSISCVRCCLSVAPKQLDDRQKQLDVERDVLVELPLDVRFLDAANQVESPLAIVADVDVIVLGRRSRGDLKLHTKSGSRKLRTSVYSVILIPTQRVVLQNVLIQRLGYAPELADPTNLLHKSVPP